MPNNILIVAGEASGDLHAADLVRQSLEKDPTLQFSGIGGDAMHDAGVNILFDAKKIAVMGFVEVLFHYRQIKKAWKIITDPIKKNKPDLLILVDYPGFNLKLAKFAKKHDIKVLYYISPQVWAWKKGRVKKIAARVDMMAVIFPFEVPIYEKANIPVKFVGHPLTQHAKPTMSKEAALDHFAIEPGKKVVGLFPGSRRAEIKRMLPTMLKSAERLSKKFDNIMFLLPIAPTLSPKDLLPFVKESNIDLNFVSHNNIYDLMNCCDAVITSSGTATLQTALIGTPMVIIYKMAWLTYRLARFFIQIPYFGLCNVVAGKKVVQELAQQNANPENISDEIEKILSDEAYNKQIKADLANIGQKLGSKASDEIASLLGKTLEAL